MFLVRLAFWITVVALLLPTPDDAGITHASGSLPVPASLGGQVPVADLEITEVANAAIASAEDVLSFCERNPSACKTGLSIAGHVQRQVFHYGSLAINWLATQGSNSPNTNVHAQTPEAPEILSPSASPFRGA